MPELYIDIGAKETKILEARVQGTRCVVYKTAEMRDMSDFVTEYGSIKSIDGFCRSLRKTLDDANIKSKDAIVSSSIFGIQHKNITKEFNNLNDCKARFSRKYGRASGTSVACDWQYYGELIRNTEVQQQERMAMCSATLVRDFVKNMKEVAGIRVLSVESPITANSNITSLYEYDYTMPSICIVDIGGTATRCQYFKNNVLMTTDYFNSSLSNLGESLAKRFDVSAPAMINAMYHIGMCTDGTRARSELAALGIKMTDYLAAVNEYISSFVAELTDRVTHTRKKYDMENIQVVISGGILSMQGMSDSISRYYKCSPCSFLTIDTVLTSSKAKVTNATDHLLSAKFGTCVGTMLRASNIHPINLVEATKPSAGRIFQGMLIIAVALLGMLWCCSGMLRNCAQTDLPGVASNTPFELTLAVGDQVSITSLGAYVGDPFDYTYLSADSSIASVDATGTISAVGVGRTKLKVIFSGADDSQQTISMMYISVLKRMPEITTTLVDVSCTTDSSPILLNIETMRPEDAVHAEITSSNETVAKISTGHSVVPLAVGTAEITVVIPETDYCLSTSKTFTINVGKGADVERNVKIVSFGLEEDTKYGMDTKMYIEVSNNKVEDVPFIVYHMVDGQKNVLYSGVITTSDSEVVRQAFMVPTANLEGTFDIYGELRPSVEGN